MKTITRTTFEIGDFPGCGQMIARNSYPEGSSDLLGIASVAFKIGYKGSRSGGFCLISLSDGMIGEPMNEERLCKFLNDDQFGFRPMTHEEIEAVMGAVGNRFNS